MQYDGHAARQGNHCAFASAAFGKVAMEVEVASEPEALISLLQNLQGAVEAIGLEAGPLSQWLHRAMTDTGMPAVLMETRQVKGALKAMPI